MNTILNIFAALLGAAVGSFLNVCIWRLPREGLRLSRPARSFCPSCGTPIAARDNIPVLGWLCLGGRCRACRSPIPARYMVVELLTAGLFLCLSWRYLGDDLLAGSPLAFTVTAVLVSAGLVGAFIDMELRIIPNEITLRGMMLAPAGILLAPEILRLDPQSAVPRFLQEMEPGLATIADLVPNALRSAVGSGLVALVAAALGLAGGLYAHRAYRRWREPEAHHPLLDSLLAGVLLAWGLGVAAFHLVRPESLHWPRLQAFWAAGLGMATGAGVIYAVSVGGSKVFRKPAMGFGDVKLMGLLGAFTGWLACIEAFFIACFLGSAIGGYYWFRYRDRYIAFGPFLTAGALLMILFPEAFEAVVAWYLGFLEVA